MGSISARTVTNSLKDNFYPTMAKEGCFGGNKSVRESVATFFYFQHFFQYFFQYFFPVFLSVFLQDTLYLTMVKEGCFGGNK